MSNINISVFGYEKQEPYPVYISKEKFNVKSTVDYKGKRATLRTHQRLNKFMYSQTKHKERKHFCMHCLQCFPNEKPSLIAKKTALQLMVHRL